MKAYPPRQKQIIVPIHDVGHASVSQSEIGDHFAAKMANNADSEIQVNFRVPPDFNTLDEAYIEAVSEQAAPTIRFDIATDYGQAGSEAYNAASETIAVADQNMTQNQIEKLSVAAALTGIEAGDSVGIKLSREGSHANDDANDVYILKLVILYTPSVKVM